MRKRRLVVTSLFIAVITIFVCLAGSVQSGLNGLNENPNTFPVAVLRSVSPSNSAYDLEIDEESLAISILDRNTKEALWASGNIKPDVREGEEHELYDNGLNATWEGFARSAFTIYYDTDKTYRSYTAFASKSAKITNTANGYNIEVDIKSIGLKFVLNLSLIGDCLTITIPAESVVETGSNKLLKIIMYPFFNSTRGLQTDEHGVPIEANYILVPDGSGALIDTARPTTATTNYTAKVYGSDMGLVGINELKAMGGVNPPRRVSFPAFGMSANGRAFITHINKGAEYSEIKANKAGLENLDYNFVYNTFIYRESYQQPVTKGGVSYIKFQDEKNKFDAEMKVMLLKDDKANYSGMAQRLREEYKALGILDKNKTQTGDTPLKIDFLMAENTSSTFGRKVLPMTTASFVREKAEELKNSGINNLHIALSGYTQGGLRGASPNHSSLEARTGSRSQYGDLFDYANENNIKLSLSADYTTVDASISKYSRSDVAMTIANQALTLPDPNLNWAIAINYETYDVLHLNAAKKYLTSDKKDFAKLNATSFQLENVGSRLTSAYHTAEYTRTMAIELERGLASEAGSNVVLRNPNSYMWNMTEDLIDIPMTNSNYIIALEAVPFMQMLLNGTTNNYREYINLNYNYYDVLSMIDFGTYPAFLLTEQSPVELLGTRSMYIFSSEYDVWESTVLDIYNEVASALNQVRGADFVSRKQLSKNVFECEYSNGKRFIVNYSSSNYSNGTISVGARNWEVI